MRLIDADALFAELNEKEIPWNRRINDIIMNQPTAYDIDKVVEQLEESKHNALIMVGYEKSHGSVDDRMETEGEVKALKYAIEIVKGGGVDE